MATSAEVELLQTCGLLPRDLGILRLQNTGQPVERTPTGEELQERFANLEIQDHEITSEAERAWKFGDQTQSEAAALDGDRKAH